MKIFLSGFESQDIDKWLEIDPDTDLKWVLMSYAYIRRAKPEKIAKIIELSEDVLIDSGAHTFRRKDNDAGWNWEQYTHEYGRWIRENDCDKVIGYFEMDIDNVVGLDKVMQLRDIMYEYTDKVIPVWHPSRGIEEYVKMCEDDRVKVVSFSFVADAMMTPEEQRWMLQTAWNNGKKVHALGMTRKDVLSTIPYDYVDSSSWLQETMYGRVGDNATRRVKGLEGIIARMASHEVWSRKQQFYYDKWLGVSPMGD